MMPVRQLPSALWQALTRDLPRLGAAGSRSAGLHRDGDAGEDQAAPSATRRSRALLRFALLRWVGTTGALLLALGALGGGALPVVDNPYQSFPGGTTLGQMMQTSSSVVLVGTALVVLAWIGMAPLVGVTLWGRPLPRVVSVRRLWTTWIVWMIPLLWTAPIFTQDIYSYLAQGAIVREGMDAYSAGPIDLLGTDHHLARSVPFIWAHSPSPYGPVAMGFSALISGLTGDSIVLGVLAHRLLSVLMLAAAGWAVLAIARRCRVYPPAALWLGILNPLVLLHLVGGIHNESLMLGLMLVGLEVGLRGVEHPRSHRRLGLLAASGALLACAGMVKVTAFLGLGFIGMAFARRLHLGGRRAPWAVTLAGLFFLAVLAATVAAVSLLSGIGLGWVTGQGGATTIRSWMSVTTDVGVIAGALGMQLGLGDHTTAMLLLTRLVGLAAAGALIVRMLLATLRGRIHPVGAFGVALFVLVVLFPVVHPWYVLWAVVPLAAWANRAVFRVAVAAYSAAFSFFVLPRGLALPAGTVVNIYLGAAVALAVLVPLGWWWFRRAGLVGLD